MVKVLNKRYELPLRTYFSQKARLKLHNKCHDGIAAVIKGIQHVATDICSSCAKEPLMNWPCSSRYWKNLCQCLAGCKCQLDEWVMMDMVRILNLSVASEKRILMFQAKEILRLLTSWHSSSPHSWRFFRMLTDILFLLLEDVFNLRYSIKVGRKKVFVVKYGVLKSS